MSFVRIESFLIQNQDAGSNKNPIPRMNSIHRREPIRKKSWSETGSDLSAAVTAAFFETVLFHPVDTVKIRLQHHSGPIRKNSETFYHSFSKVIFANNDKANFHEKVKGMYQGLGWAIAYKMVQRTVKLGFQPTLKANLDHNFSDQFHEIFGKNAHIAMHIAASVPLSWLELFVLCFDTLKVKRQTDINAYKGQSFLDIMQTENLFGRAFWVSASRITLGTACFFGMPIAIKQFAFDLEPDAKMTTFQNFATSAAGAGSAILLVNPFDVVKTRMMAMRLSKSEKVTGINTAISIAKVEGPRAFSKGLATALLCNWPRSTFAMFAVNKLRDVFNEKFSAVKIQSSIEKPKI